MPEIAYQVGDLVALQTGRTPIGLILIGVLIIIVAIVINRRAGRR